MQDQATLEIVNREDRDGHFWAHDYRVTLGAFGNAYGVNADNEQDALDYVMDYCEEHAPGFVMSREDEEECEWPEEYIRAGNHGLLFSCPAHEMQIQQLA